MMNIPSHSKKPIEIVIAPLNAPWKCDVNIAGVSQERIFSAYLRPSACKAGFMVPSGQRFTGSRAYDTSPGRRRRNTLLRFKRDRDHQAQQQTLLYQSESLMKGSSYCVFLCVAEFIHDKFPRVKTECNRVHEGLQRKRRLPARARIVRRCQEQAERSSAQPLRFTYL
jgi:hypothetical protein